MASKSKSIAGLFEAHKRLKLDISSESTCGIEGGQEQDDPASTDGSLHTQKAEICISEELLTHPNGALTNLEVKEELPQEQRMRIELNKAAANAIRNVKVCEERVTEAKGMAVGLLAAHFGGIIVRLRTAFSKRLSENDCTAALFPKFGLCMLNIMDINGRVYSSCLTSYPVFIMLFPAQGLPFPEFKSLLVEPSWSEVLSSELGKPYIEKLYHFVKEEAATGCSIYPPPENIFNAFNTCPFKKVKVVILGQDPYHGPGQAMGLCFSVQKGVRFPPSLFNIFKEIQDDIGCTVPPHGNLDKWSHQGVLLLNTVLTVRGGKANSHAKKGWEAFTDAAIKAVASQSSGIVFLLWGNSAQEKIRLINQSSHHILKAAHPSGLSAHKGFFKCRHFSKTNEILEKQGLLRIDWQV
ncbi:hypothetical protein L7F22_058971 [Adiantum nelumboides]|nr:hypothetical protein [Adiantum nelumboides]